MAGPLHQPECIGRAGRVEGTVGEGRIDALLKQPEQLIEYLACQLRPLDHELIGVDAEIAEIVAEELEADAIVLVEVPLSEFDEPTKRP